MREYDRHNPENRRFCHVGAIISAGATVVGSMMSSDNSSDAARYAADAQSGASAAQVAEYRRQFDTVRELLQPYVNTGSTALSGYNDLIGLNGDPAQQFSIDQIRKGPAFGSLKQVGENAILQNASATGGLRGGNTQAALSQFDEGLLSSLINDRLAKLGGLVSVGQNAAAGVGNAGMQTGQLVGGALGTAGQAQAGGALGAAAAANSGISGIVNAAGQIAGRIPTGYSLFGNGGGYAVNNPQGTADPSGLYYPEY